MPSYNYKDAYVCFVDNDPQTAFAAGEVTKANCKLIGVTREESGFKLSKEETQRTSFAEERVMSYKGEINVQVITTLSDTVRQAIDGKKISILFLDAEGVYIPDDAVNLASTGVVLPASPKGTMIAPTTVFIEEDEKYGTGKIQSIVITGTLVKASKDSIRKTVNIVTS